MLVSRRSAVALMGAAAAAPLARPAFAQGTRTVVGALRFTSHAPSFVALERGYFAEEGLDVELSFFEAAQPMAVAVAGRDVDFAVTAITGGLVSLAQKGAARVIAGGLREEPGIPGQMILASNAAFEAGLKAPADLGGKRFGVTQPGSSFHYMGARIAEAEGVEMEFVPLQKTPALIGALSSGQIDAWSIVPHIGTPLVEGGKAALIGKVSDYLPDYQVTTVFTSAETAANERDRTEAFLRAFQRGADDFNAALVDRTAGDDAMEEMVALLHPYVYPDRELEAARGPIVAGAMRMSTALAEASIRDQLDWFASEGLTDAVPYETVVDTSYVPAG